MRFIRCVLDLLDLLDALGVRGYTGYTVLDISYVFKAYGWGYTRYTRCICVRLVRPVRYTRRLCGLYCIR